jgi:ElaB/YqjD/DUF883 family membrane-anchored ribosome-binding protein
MSDASGMAEDAMDAVADSIAKGASSARQHAADLLNGTAEALDEMHDDFMADDRVKRASQKAKRAVSASRDYFNSNDLEDMLVDVADAVRRHPGKALVALAATGFLFGRMLRRSR